MGFNRWFPLAVLTVLIAVTSVAWAEPETLTDPPGYSTVSKAAGEGQAQVDQGASEANQKADSARQAATETKYRALETAGTAAAGAQGQAASMLGTAQDLLGHALRNFADLVGGLLGEGGVDALKTTPTGTASVSASSAGVAPMSDPGLLGVALVVAAGAVGGALLWVTVLQRAVMMGLVPLLSRIAHSEIYLNDARRLISELAAANPGLCLNEIVAKTGYSRNAVSYHLFVLEKEEELVSVKDGKYRRYFPRGGKYVNGAKNVVSVLKNDQTLKMAQRIVAQPGTIQRELCRNLGMTASAACWHARRLEELGVIRKQRVANTVQYYPGEAVGKYDLSEFGLSAAPMLTPTMA